MHLVRLWVATPTILRSFVVFFCFSRQMQGQDLNKTVTAPVRLIDTIRLVKVAWQVIHEMSFQILGEESGFEPVTNILCSLNNTFVKFYRKCVNKVLQTNPLTKYFLLYLFTCSFIQAETKQTKINSVACSPQANYTDLATAACQRS
jgi:hypothetical protein